jgi:hypothetical protein
LCKKHHARNTIGLRKNAFCAKGDSMGEGLQMNFFYNFNSDTAAMYLYRPTT